MAEISADNKRIAKNTVIIYVRLFVIMFIGLFSSRFVLQLLGVSDYGLFNVVGSVIALLSFISGSLSSTTVRFMNFELGKPEGDPNRMFNICVLVHIAVAVLIFLLLEIVGVWYVNNYLNVEAGKLGDAMFIFQVSTIVSCISFVSIPFMSLFVAYERFFFTSILEIICKCLSFALVIFLLYSDVYSLRLFALLSALLSLSCPVIYICQSVRNWPEITKFKFVGGWSSYKELIVFNNYNLLSTFSLVGRATGSNIIINLFFGTAVNAAYGIASSVQQYVNTFIANFDTASAPQITQNLGAHNLERAESIVYRVGKLCLLLALLVVFPLITEMEYILQLWLVHVPDGTPEFCYSMLAIAIVGSTSAGLLQYINALGKIKWFKITMSVLMISCLPIGYVLFKLSFPSYSILVLFIIADVVHRIIQLVQAHIILGFNSLKYIHKVYMRPFIIALLLLTYLYLYKMMYLEGIGHFVGLAISLVTTMVLIWVIGLDKVEQDMLYNEFKKRYNRIIGNDPN